MRTRLYIATLLLFTSLILSAKTVVLKGTLSVKYIEKCKNGLDTVAPTKDETVQITGMNATTKISDKLGNANKDGSFTISFPAKKYEFIIFSIVDSDVQESYFVDDLKKRQSINITLYYKNFNHFSIEGGVPVFNNAGNGMLVKKPAIYLYPTKTDTIDIKLDFKGQLGTTYPKYNEGWKVIAKPTGELLNLADNRTYNYLFWEGSYNFAPEHYDYPYGTVVAKSDLTSFLQEKLSFIGLNTTEINDFMVYWLPELENNNYNLIYFFINDDIDGSAFLQVNPEPDTQIRIYMEFKKVDANFKSNPQQFVHIERNGFTLVEWGGGVSSIQKIE